MSKLDDLTALREANIVRLGSNAVRQSIDDVQVVKYLDGLSRKATTLEEVDLLDVIMKSLFHEEMNKVTERVHGDKAVQIEAVPETDVPAKDDAPKFDKKAYQRDLMRKRRAEEKDGRT